MVSPSAPIGWCSQPVLARYPPGRFTACAAQTVAGSPSVPRLDPVLLGRCAWMVDVSAQTLNIAAPDTHTHYWVQPYVMDPKSEIVITGIYPFARYFSFVTYTSDGLPIGNVSLHDSEIVPDSGSINPFTTPDPPTDLDQRRYTARIVPSPPPPLLPTLWPGCRLIRPAVSAGWSIGCTCPIIPTSRRLECHSPASLLMGCRGTCTAVEQAVFDRVLAPLFDAIVAANSPDPATVVRDPSLFRRAPSLAGLFPNPDNQYVLVASDWAPGRVVVLRGKGFTFPDTRDGGSVTTPGLRYWSWCSNELANPYPAVQCAADDEIVLDAEGYYTIAISLREDRPRNATKANGVTWLAWKGESAAVLPEVVPNITYLRTMLPDFTQAAQGVPEPTPGATAQELAAQAAAAMGPYPVGVYCTKAQFEANGPLSCF